MFTRRSFLWVAYVVATLFLFELLRAVLPERGLVYFQSVASCLLCVVVGNVLYNLTSHRLFSKTVSPVNKAVLVTGCDSGFGNHLAQRLDSRGYDVFAGCLFAAQDGATDLKKRCSDRLRIVQLDVTNDESVLSARAFVKDNLGTSDLWAVVNNAGVYEGFNVECTSMDSFRKCLDVNALGQVRVTKAFLPFLRQSKGRVVCVNSLASRVVLPNVCAYTMSKFASAAFTECLRVEMEAWDVKVISIEPYFFRTPMTRPQRIRSYFDEVCSGADEGVLADYGEPALELSKSLLEATFRTASDDVGKVTDALCDAVGLEHPDSVFAVVDGLLLRLLAYLVVRLPAEALYASMRLYKRLGWVHHSLRKRSQKSKGA